MKIQSFFTHPCVVPNLNDVIFSMDHKSRDFFQKIFMQFLMYWSINAMQNKKCNKNIIKIVHMIYAGVFNNIAH